jgi:ABC-type amino acid transport substrate-binding protein
LIISFSLLLFLVTIFPQPIEAAEPEALIGEIRKIQKKGSLTIGIPPYNTPPFYYKDPKTGELLGYDIDIARALAKKIGVAPIFDTTSGSFNDLVKRAGSGDVDLAIGKLGTTYPRILNANPHAYMKFHQALLINRKSLVRIGNENDPHLGVKLKLSNLRIAAIENSAYDERAYSQFPNASIIPAADWDGAVQALLSDKVDAIYRDSLEMDMLVLKDLKLTLRYASVLIEDLDDVKSIFVGESNSGIASLIDFLISDEFPVINEEKIIKLYPHFFRKPG